MKPLLLLLSLLPLCALSAADPESGIVGRYQLYVVPPTAENYSPIIYRLDTQTGKVWIYNEAQKEIVVAADAKEQEMIQSLNKQGMIYFHTPAWKELSEKSDGKSIETAPPGHQFPKTVK